VSAAQPNPYAPPTANVSDVEVDSGVIEQAGRGARFGAAILDGIFMALLVYVPALMIGGVESLGAAAGGDYSQLIFSSFGYAAFAGLIVWGVITFVLVKRNSQTLGKKLVGIKVVRSDGSHASLARIFWLRNVVNGIPTAIPIVGNVYALVDHLFIFTESRQCLHDKIADTIVIKA
jgi:uncharacterized RDD family membrane protein YckC